MAASEKQSDPIFELLLGCGHRREKILAPRPTDALEFHQLTTLDGNPACHPDVLWNLENCPWRPLIDDSFDEVHAYEVLEHLGHQGNACQFFYHFHEIYRVLKPGGYLLATVPSRFSPWAWGDPSHTRMIVQESLVFLDRAQVAANRKRGTPLSDFSSLWCDDFRIVASEDNHVNHIFCLQAMKPVRNI